VSLPREVSAADTEGVDRKVTEPPKLLFKLAMVIYIKYLLNKFYLKLISSHICY